jgi:hypothetical protein
VRVLEQEQLIADLAALALLDERLLQREAVLVADGPESANFQL